MTTKHWTAAFVVAAMLVSCKPAGNSADRTGDAGTTGAATPVDTTMTGGQGGMADTGMRGTADTTPTGADTCRP